jgi:fatty acid desaturase
MSRTKKNDYYLFAQEIEALKDKLKRSKGQADLVHIKRLSFVFNTLCILGLFTVYLTPNIFTVLALTIANFGKFVCITHPVLHGAYDDIPGVPKRLTKAHYANGFWRRLIDWYDCIEPKAWEYEHNALHHHHLASPLDPNEAERVSNPTRTANAPILVKRIAIFGFSLCWKPVYLAFSAANSRLNKESGLSLSEYKDYIDPEIWTLKSDRVRFVVKHAILFYYAPLLIGIPLLGWLFIGPAAAANAFITLLIAELLANLWSHIVIAASHAGEDITLFDSKAKSKGEYYYRQVITTINYQPGGCLVSFFHGWSNYHIEHHLFPEATLLQLEQVWPEVEKICEKHGVPYKREPILKRYCHLLNVIVGKETHAREINNSSIPA